MMDLTILQQKITACTGIAFADFEDLVYLDDVTEKAKQVAQALAEQAEADEAAFALLTEMAHHIDTSVKLLAGMIVERLQRRFDDVAYALVHRLVRDMEEYVARYGAYALGHFATYRNDARACVWELCDADWAELRWRGVGALGTMVSDSEAQKRLAKMLREDDSASVRHFAAEALTKARELIPAEAHRVILDSLRAIERESVNAALASLEGVMELTSEQLLAMLTALAQDSSAKVREVVARSLQALAKEHPEQVLALTLPLLCDEDVNVRDGAQYCLWALCETRDETIFAAVVSLAEDQNAHLRAAAAFVLGNFHRTRGAEALALLERLVADEEWLVRGYVPISLILLRRSFPDQSLVILTRLAQDQNEGVRQNVANMARFFAKAHPHQVLALLTSLAEDKDRWVRRQTALSLVALAKYLTQECLLLIIKLAGDDADPDTPHNAGAALETIIDRQPEQALMLLDRLLCALPRPGALAWIARMGRREEVTAIARALFQLWEAQWYIVESDSWQAYQRSVREGKPRPELIRTLEPALDEIAQSVHEAISLIRPLQDRYAHGREVIVLLELAQFCLECQTLAECARKPGVHFPISFPITFEQTGKEFETLEALKEPFLLVEMVDFGRQLAQARDQVGKYLARTDRREQEMLLVETLRILERAEAFAEQSLYPPYQQLAQRIATHWRELVRAALENLRGRALLRLRLLSDRHPFGETVDVGLEVCNLGDETAEQVALHVADSTDYWVVHADPSLEYLAPGARATWRCVLHLPHARPTRLAVTAVYCQRGLDTPQMVEFADVLTFFDQADRYPFVPLERNPYVTGGPLQTDDVFFGRDRLIADLAADLQGMHQDNVIVLYGQRRTGKTSLLYALQRRLPKERYIPVFYDAEGVDSPLSLFWGLANHICDASVAAGIALPEPARDDYTAEASSQFEYSFLRQVGLALGQRRLLLMIDEFESIEVAVKAGYLPETVFPFLRRLMQHQRQLSFIFCGTHQLQELTRYYWQIFFNAALPCRVTFLDKAATLALIQEPVRGHFVYDELALQRLLALTGGHPFFTQLFCHSLVRLVSERQRGYVTRNEVDDVAHQLAQTGHDHLDYIWEQSSPAEQALLLALTEETQRQQRVEMLWEPVEARLGAQFPAGISATDQARASLERRELVTSDGPRIHFTMALIPEWLAIHHTWSSLERRRKE